MVGSLGDPLGILACDSELEQRSCGECTKLSGSISDSVVGMWCCILVRPPRLELLSVICVDCQSFIFGTILDLHTLLGVSQEKLGV